MLSDGDATVRAVMSRSNSGLVGTRGIDPQDKNESLSDQEEIKIGLFQPPSDKGTFIASIINNTADQNFAQQAIKAEMTDPATLSSPVCTKGGVNADPLKHSCVFEKTVLDLVIRFSNYNYPTCSGLGTKWVYDAQTNQCVLPPRNKNDLPSYGIPQIRSFSACSMSSPTGSLKIVNRTVVAPGTVGEYTEFKVERNGPLTLWDAISGITNPTFGVDFKKICP